MKFKDYTWDKEFDIKDFLMIFIMLHARLRTLLKFYQIYLCLLLILNF